MAERKRVAVQMADAEKIERLVVALKAAQQFLSPEIPRGPSVNGWLNTVQFIDDALLAATAQSEQTE